MIHIDLLHSSVFRSVEIIIIWLTLHFAGRKLMAYSSEALTGGRYVVQILPNLTRDLSFIESIIPVYTVEQNKGCSKHL